MTLTEFIASHGYSFLPDQLDGKFHEFTDSLNNKGWYIGSELTSGKITFTFGDWRRPDQTHSFITEQNLTPEEQRELKETTERFTLEKNSRQEQAKRNIQEIFARWERLGSAGESKYLAQKNLPPRIPGTVVKPVDVGGHVLVVPLRDEFGVVWNFQSIFDSGDKQFFNFGRVSGLFFELKGSEKIIICEGFGTGVALNTATGFTVIVAFTLGNLRAIAEKFPGAAIAGDFDGATKQKMKAAGNPDAHNPGLRGAVGLGLSLGREIFSPVKDLECERNVDFSDLYIEGGADLVKKAFELPLDLSSQASQTSQPQAPPTPNTSPPQRSTVERWVNGINPFPIRVSQRGMPILPEEVTIAEKLYSYWEGKLAKSSEGDVFLWTGKVWKLADKTDEQTWLQQIMVMHGGYGTNSRFQSIFKIFVSSMIPFTGQNLYAPNPYRITFNNGTLSVDLIGGKWKLTFGPHNKYDYSVNLIPHDYDPDNTAINPMFEETLRNILGDEEFDAKRRAVAQLFGSCLAPVYPRLFLLVGKTGSGKSTLVILASKLVSGGNIANVQPADFQGFLMESMVGKLVNMVTDIDFVKPISDAVIKQIEDRVPILINRKNKIAVMAPFPSVHVFGANELPPTLERGSMAHTRRWTFIPCNYFQRDVTEHDKHRVDKILEAGMQGLINFAVEGLKDLLESQGHFFVPESGKVSIAKWQTNNDPIQSFLETIKTAGKRPKNMGGYWPDITLDAGERCYTNVLWEEFKLWHEDNYNAKPRIPKMKFYMKLEGIFGERQKYAGYWVFRGLVSEKSPVGSLGKEKDPESTSNSANSRSDAGCKLFENSNENF